MIRLAVPDIGVEEIDAILSVLKSGFLVQGEQVEAFENKVASFVETPHAIAVSSCTAALHLALLALGIGQGDEVIVPDFTFPATVNAVELTGAKPIFCDIDRRSFCLSPELLESLITHNTKAIIPVHEFGYPAKMTSIMEIAERSSVHVIEDAACALGTVCGDKMAGTLGVLGCFSFHPRKAITTGEGGVVITHDDTLADRIRVLRNHGIQNVNGKIQFVAAGLNYRMTNFQGALGVAQMSKLNKIIDERIYLAGCYKQYLAMTDKIILPSDPENGRHIYQTFHILLDPLIDRDAVIHRMKENGIETNYGAYAVHNQPYYQQKYMLNGSNYPESLAAFHNGLALPLHGGISDKQIHLICDTLIRNIY